MQKHYPVDSQLSSKKPESSTFNERAQLIHEDEKWDERGGTSNQDKKKLFGTKAGSEGIRFNFIYSRSHW